MKRKLSLSKTEQREYIANAKRLRAVGIISPEEEPLPEVQMLALEQTGGPAESSVHAPSVGGYGIVVWVRIVALKSGISVCDCQITPQKWSDTNIFLVDATERVPYFKSIAGVEYPRNDVVNHWISGGRYLKRGQILQGVVIAQSFGSLPTWCDNGISVGAELCFVDQFGNLYPLKVDLRVIRDRERIGRPRHRTGLFGPAVNASSHGTYREKPGLGGREGISLKEASVPRPNGPVHKYQRFI
jgi:hypothetical protein